MVLAVIIIKYWFTIYIAKIVHVQTIPHRFATSALWLSSEKSCPISELGQSRHSPAVGPTPFYIVNMLHLEDEDDNANILQPDKGNGQSQEDYPHLHTPLLTLMYHFSVKYTYLSMPLNSSASMTTTSLPLPTYEKSPVICLLLRGEMRTSSRERAGGWTVSRRRCPIRARRSTWRYDSFVRQSTVRPATRRSS